ncbi:50S ribosomal protein L25 [Candidatus Desantisbacteria bacterium]|nr:50S ribosomal protein L25 [Candidatus Desantisbacteria bacterium]
MEQIELVVKIRESKGKSKAKKMRKTGQIPGIIYGNNEQNTNITVSANTFSKLMANQENEHIILPLKLIDENDAVIGTKTAILKNIQKNPLTDNVIHVDFQQVALDKKIRISVPVKVQGKAEGVKSGGVLEYLVHEIEVECFPQDVPPNITIDVTALKIGESYHVKSIPPIDKVRIVSQPDMTIVVVSTIRKEEEEKVVKKEEAAAGTTAAAEPELVAKKGKAEEAKETPKEATKETKEKK